MYSLVLMAALTTGGEAPAWFFRHGCHGCHGCYGGCFGCHGCWGGGWSCGGCYGGGCYGCYGGGYGGCYGGCYGCYGGGYGGWYGGHAPAMGMPMAPSAPPTETVPAPKKEDEKRSSTAGPAKLIVELPADAKLFVDDQLMKATSAIRTFNTPSLSPGQAYYYMLRAEVVRDGQPVQETKRVIVRAGQTVRASFPDLGTVATARAETALAR
jgi:uncharacterized protein (TIGR03000 family)